MSQKITTIIVEQLKNFEIWLTNNGITTEFEFQNFLTVQQL